MDKPEGCSDKETSGRDFFGLMTTIGDERFARVGRGCGMWVGYAMEADHPERIAFGEAIVPGVAVPPPLISDDGQLSDSPWHNNFFPGMRDQ
ncbi:hypothetical protein C8J45_102362 [Sphingomonas sp. PP-CE-3G-477]|uniref:hypothetical protein n=1 Tax=Sphingomonas sp. PP-CE-3G-477 TaxID=2135660 RepID=UPI000D4025D1|nr:hypothetical protein [Sphingomonas sp. PP-CE-3G-477]PTQ65004.1 hypothetical protein C8J45_102362 [Sphingomonas sp. PP-CE-3G-477]